MLAAWSVNVKCFLRKMVNITILLKVMHSVLQLIVLRAFLCLKSTFNCPSESAINIMSYLRLLRICPLIINSGYSSFLRIVLLQWLNKSGQKMHACLTPLSILVFSLNLFSISLVVPSQGYVLIKYLSHANQAFLLS